MFVSYNSSNNLQINSEDRLPALVYSATTPPFSDTSFWTTSVFYPYYRGAIYIPTTFNGRYTIMVGGSPGMALSGVVFNNQITEYGFFQQGPFYTATILIPKGVSIPSSATVTIYLYSELTQQIPNTGYGINIINSTGGLIYSSNFEAFKIQGILKHRPADSAFTSEYSLGTISTGSLTPIITLGSVGVYADGGGNDSNLGYYSISATFQNNSVSFSRRKDLYNQSFATFRSYYRWFETRVLTVGGKP